MAIAESIELWPEGAPGLDTAHPCQIPTITPYLLPTDRPHGAVVVCPGGGYSHLADHEGGPVAEWLNSLGISAIVCHYRVAPYRHPYPLLDGQRAVRWLRHHAEHYHLKPDRIGILGFSAGGHLASTVATHVDPGEPSAADPIDRVSARPDAAILCYPVISFTTFPHQGSCTNLLGEDASPERRRELSNELQVSADTPPAFLWHTMDDPGVPVENTLNFAAACSGAGVPCEVHVFAHGAHGLGLAPNDPAVAQWLPLAADWLRRLGF